MTRLIRSLSDHATTGPNYAEVGATRTGPLPAAGYHHLHHTVRVGRGRAAYLAAGEAVTTWAMHRATGARVTSAAGRAEPGVTLEVSLGFGPVRFTAPCQVIWTTYTASETGFAYGTRTGHPECGEESFVVDLREDGSVWFTVTAFSRAAAWYTRLGGPVVRWLQHAYARMLGRTLAELVARRAADPAGALPGDRSELRSFCTHPCSSKEAAMSQYDEYTNPSQAEGERLDEDMDATQKAHVHAEVTRTTPSQAEGERTADDDDRKR